MLERFKRKVEETPDSPASSSDSNETSISTYLKRPVEGEVLPTNCVTEDDRAKFRANRLIWAKEIADNSDGKISIVQADAALTKDPYWKPEDATPKASTSKLPVETIQGKPEGISSKKLNQIWSIGKKP